MQIIRKKICLEGFKSRIPGYFPVVNAEEENSNGSWGNIPYAFNLFDIYEEIADENGNVTNKLKHFKYETVITLYYEAKKSLVTAIYKEYDGLADKWLNIEYDWRDAFTDLPKIVSELPVKAVDGEVYGVTSESLVKVFYDEINKVFGGNRNGYDLINEVNKVIGITIVSSQCHGIRVPYMVYHKDVPDIIEFLNKLKASEICCERKLYEDYGGDTYLEFLNSIEIGEKEITFDENTTFTIPVTLVGDIRDMGVFTVAETEGDADNEDKTVESTKIVSVQGESKLPLLRKRRVSYDDDGNYIPGIFNKEAGMIELPYEVGYVKNLQVYNGKYYGDLIAEIDFDKAEFTYVIGGRLKYTGSKFQLDEVNPFRLDEGDDWDGEGVWYQEEHEFLKDEITFTYDGVEVKTTAFDIDFSKSTEKLNYDGIDFPRENYILSKEIIYRPREAANDKNLTSFKDEKTLSLAEGIRENYDVNINRGSSAAFERHLKLAEIKSFKELESTGINYFN